MERTKNNATEPMPIMIVVALALVIVGSGILAPTPASTPAPAPAPAPAPVNSTSNTTASDSMNETVKALAGTMAALIPVFVVIAIFGLILSMLTGRNGLFRRIGREQSDSSLERALSAIERRSRSEIPSYPGDEPEEKKETPNAAEALEQPKPRSIDEPPTPAQRIRRDDP